jgi:hypothetical protein
MDEYGYKSETSFTPHPHWWRGRHFWPSSLQSIWHYVGFTAGQDAVPASKSARLSSLVQTASSPQWTTSSQLQSLDHSAAVMHMIHSIHCQSSLYAERSRQSTSFWSPLFVISSSFILTTLSVALTYSDEWRNDEWTTNWTRCARKSSSYNWM